MKIEIRCPGCRKGYLVDEAMLSGEMICPDCYARIDLGSGDSGAAAAETPATLAPVEPAAQVVCPRCNLHFSPRGSGGEEPAGNDGRPTVLVVEDLECFRDLAVDALAEGYNVKSAASVNEARSTLSEGGIDLILLDLTLDGGNHGIDLLREFPFKPCPILIYTDQEESELLSESWEDLRKLGADDIVKKSMNVGEKLLHKVDALLGRTWEDEDLVVNTVTSRE